MVTIDEYVQQLLLTFLASLKIMDTTARSNFLKTEPSERARSLWYVHKGCGSDGPFMDEVVWMDLVHAWVRLSVHNVWRILAAGD